MKRLITASVVKQERQAGRKRLEYCLAECIVTPEARTIAEQLGMVLVDVCAPGYVAPKPEAAGLSDKDLAAIRAAIMAKIPAGSVPESVIDQLVQKAAKEHCAAPAAGCCAPASGIKLVEGKHVAMGIFEGAGKENRVGLADVITDKDGSSMGAGFMEWEKCFFPWTLTYDEVDYVIEGELHIRCNGQTTIGKAGDVLFIPKNSSIEFGTPTRVKFLFVAYPANWAEIG